MSTRTVEVPEGAKAIIVSDQLLAQYSDWTKVPERLEARIEATDDPNVVDVRTRRNYS